MTSNTSSADSLWEEYTVIIAGNDKPTVIQGKSVFYYINAHKQDAYITATTTAYFCFVYLAFIIL